MAYASSAYYNAKGRPTSGSRNSSLSSRFIKTASIATIGAVATVILAVATLSATSVSTRTNEARRGGLSALMLTSPEKQARVATANNFVGKKFARLKLPVNDSVKARFAFAEENAVKGNPLLKAFEMALLTREPAAANAKANSELRSRLLAPVQTASLSAPQLTRSLSPKAEIAETLEVAIAKPAENPFEAVLNDPELDIPLPASRPRYAEQSTPTIKLAYAKPDAGLDEVLPEINTGPKLSKGVAIYDITAQKVYLPDGKVMEAHSGLGDMRDDPKYTKVKGRGPTPPNRYKLSMREKLFHGVPALRMTPANWAKMHGRNGILAHSYLRRRPGDSAGCIAFKDYYKFLEYYKKGLVKEIIVVERMSDSPDSPVNLASLSSGR